MVPATVGGVVALLVLVLPGLAFELIRQRRRAGRNDSTFVEINRVVVAGLGLGAVTAFLLSLVAIVGPRSQANLPGLLQHTQWLAQHLWVSGWTACSYGVVSVTLAAVAAAVLPGLNDAGSIHAESGWVSTFDRLPRVIRGRQGLEHIPLARLSVRLVDGTTYVGDRADYSTDQQLGDRELTLGGALACRPAGATDTTLLPKWHRVLLRGDQISDILVQYVPGPAIARPRGEEVSVVRWLRAVCAQIVGRPGSSTWRELLEAPMSYPRSALRIFVAEVVLLLVVAALSHIS